MRILLILLVLMAAVGCSNDSADTGSSNDTETETETDDTTGYAIVDTGQTDCYDDDGNEITCPESGEPFYGQDAQFNGNHPSFTNNGDGTVTDNVTGLMWQQTPENIGYSYEEAQAYCESLELGAHDDWRIPTTKELFSISDFLLGWPYLDTTYFDIKELQSIVDYSRSPSASGAADLGTAIDTDYFEITELSAGTTDYDPDYGYFWSSTSAYFGGDSQEYYHAWSVAFGTAVDGDGADMHGAGGMRFDTKYEGGALGEGGERYYNYVRLVRDAE